MNILARSRFTSPSPVFGFGIWPRKSAAFCACITTNSMKRWESSPLCVVFWTSAMAHFCFATANEETRSEIAACFIDQFQRVAIRARQACAAKPDHNHALRLVLPAFDRFRFAKSNRGFCVGEGKRAGLHLAK